MYETPDMEVILISKNVYVTASFEYEDKPGDGGDWAPPLPQE